MKSIKTSSSHLRTEAKDLAPGRRRRPLLSTTGRGAPVESARKCVSGGLRVAGQRTEEQLAPGTLVYDVLVRHTEHLHDARQLLKVR